MKIAAALLAGLVLASCTWNEFRSTYSRAYYNSREVVLCKKIEGEEFEICLKRKDWDRLKR